MKDKDRIIRWINTVLGELSQLDGQQGVELLHVCGGECFETSVLLEGAKKIRDEFNDNKDVGARFDAFKKQYCDTPRLTKEGDLITLIFEECTCPMVREGVNNSFLCNCTVGYTTKIFETLFGQNVAVKLEKSILKGDDICEQHIIVHS